MRLVLLLTLGVLAAGGLPAAAHPISMTEAVVDVHADHVAVELSVFVEDITAFHAIPADGEGRYPAAHIRTAAKSKHVSFVDDGLTLRDAEGRTLKSSTQVVDTNGLPGEDISETQLKEFTVTYRLTYPLKQRPGFITVSQQFGGVKAILPAIMDCTVLQAGVLLDTSRPLLGGQSHTARFDWDNPPKPVRNWRELRERRRKELRQRLGIASYSGLYSFIYITPREVRHEVLIPLLTLEQWVPIKRSNPDFLEVDEQQAVRKSIESFFSARNPVSINGLAVQPKLTRLNFFGLDIRDFALNAKPRRVGVYQARVGVILSYQPQEYPSELAFHWELFSQHAPFLRSIVYEFDRSPVEHFFRPDEAEFHWSGRAPSERVTVQTVEAGESRIDRALAAKVTGVLLGNVYAAFGLRDEEATYDSLATAIDGPLLRTLYLQIRRSLLMSEQGGARSRVDEFSPVSTRLIRSADGEFEVEHRWRMTGTVEHWGHIHTRENEYAARIVVKSVDGSWKMSRVTFTDQKRVRFQTEIRGMENTES